MTSLKETGAPSLNDRILPIFSLLLFAIIMLLPVGSGAANVIMPNLVLIGCFYWTVRQPHLLPYGACAGIGLILDLWLSVPLGLNMLMLLVMRLFIVSQNRFFRGQTGALQWSVFTGTAFVLYCAAWLLTALAQQTWPPIEPVVTQWLVTSLLFAPIGILLGRLRRVVM